MEYSGQLCVIARHTVEAEILCINEVGQVTALLSGIDYFKFHQEFPTPKGPSEFPKYIISRQSPSRLFVNERTNQDRNPILNAIKKDKNVSETSKDVAEYLLKEYHDADEEGKGDISPMPFSLGEKGSASVDVYEQSAHGKESVVRFTSGKYWTLWDTTHYIPWVSDPMRNIKKNTSPSSEVEKSIKLMDHMIKDISSYMSDEQYKYPYHLLFDDKEKLSPGSGMPEFMFTMLNTITGIYNRDEYAFMYVTRICYANGKKGRNKERLRQARLFGHNRLPMNKTRDDIAMFDTYDGDWGNLRAVVCLINMQPQEDVKNVDGPLEAEKELTGKHWVAMIFATGEPQEFFNGLETRINREDRKNAKERRMYLIDPYVINELKKVKGKQEYVKTEEFAKYRQNILNRACWQCHRAGLVSAGVVCTSGYTPTMTTISEETGVYPHKQALYPDVLSSYGLLDYLLAYTEVEPPSILNEIYYDRKVLIVGTKGNEAERDIVKQFRDIVKQFREKEEIKKLTGKSYTMLLESVMPSCLILYETPKIDMVPFFLISTIQSILLSDIMRNRKSNLFPYTTAQIFNAMSAISQAGATSRSLYSISSRGGISEYASYLSPYNTFVTLYRQVSMPVFAANMKVSFDILSRLYNVYYNMIY